MRTYLSMPMTVIAGPDVPPTALSKALARGYTVLVRESASFTVLTAGRRDVIMANLARAFPSIGVISESGFVVGDACDLACLLKHPDISTVVAFRAEDAGPVPPIVLTAEIDAIDIEDAGMSQTAQIDLPEDDAFFVRLHSYSEDRRHVLMDRLRGRHVEIIIRVLD